MHYDDAQGRMVIFLLRRYFDGGIVHNNKEQLAFDRSTVDSLCHRVVSSAAGTMCAKCEESINQTNNQSTALSKTNMLLFVASKCKEHLDLLRSKCHQKPLGERNVSRDKKLNLIQHDVDYKAWIGATNTLRR